MRINTNLTAMNTFNQVTNNQNKIASSVAKLSSGYAINTAADNAAGLAISEKMRAQIRGLDKASANAQDAISLIQTAEGALDSSTEILQRMRELAVQSASDTNEDIDRNALQDEFAQLQQELNDVSKNTTFNKKNLLDGSLASSSKSITNISLGNNSLAVSSGKAAAGDYNFSVAVKQETAAVEGSKPTDYSATFGSTATGYFKDVSSGTYLTDEACAVTLGENASASSLLNGNYSLSTTSNTDGSLTVTATSDNGQTFSATLSAGMLNTLEADSAGAAVELNLTFSAEADDAFTLSLGIQDFSNTTNGIEALSNAIMDTTVSISGGVTEQAATYGVYASITGGSAVKLATGDSSVTFDNGVTVSFNELTASDLDTANKGSLDIFGAITSTTTLGSSHAGGASTTITGTANSLANFKFTDSGIVEDGAWTTDITSTYDATAKATTFTVTDAGGNTFTAVLKDSDMSAQTATGIADGGGTATLNFSKALSFADSAGNVAFTADYASAVTVTNAGTGGPEDSTVTYVGAADTFTIDGTNYVTADSSHNYSKVFGDGTASALTNNGASSFTVASKANEGLTFQVGANEGDTMSINIEKMDSETLGVNSAKIDTKAAAQSALDNVDSAINQISSQRAALGAVQNRLEYKINNLSASSENLTSAESQIRDVDMAKEMTNFTNANILNQAAVAMLAQANALPQSVLSLIGG